MILVTCTDPGIIQFVKILKTIFQMIQILGPILAMVSLAILFLKMIGHSNEKEYLLYKKHIKNCIIALVITFFLPVFVTLVMSATFMEDSFEVSACWDAADKVSLSGTGTYQEPTIRKNTTGSYIINPSDYTGSGIDTNPNSTGDDTVSIDNSNVSNLNLKIAEIAKNHAWPLHTSKKVYKKKYYGKKHSADCGEFVEMVVQTATKKDVPNFLNTMLKYKKSGSNPSKLNSVIKKYGFTAYAYNGKVSSLQPGDILTYKKSGYTGNGKGQHIMVYIGPTSNNKYLFAEASHPKHYYGHLTTKKANADQLNHKKYAYYYVIRGNN